MDVLHERRLRLSRKKIRIGAIDKDFHFLGINNLETQPLDGTNDTQVSPDQVGQSHYEYYFITTDDIRLFRQVLINEYLSKSTSFRTFGRCEMPVSRLNKWWTLRSILAESSVTCISGEVGRLKAGSMKNYWDGF